jgi:hypothetical protein
VGPQSVALPICGNCDSCLARTRALLRVPPRRALLPGPRPTAAGLERHARKYGPEQVAETAAEYGVSIAIERPKRERKSRGPSLRTRVKQYVAQGYGPDVIAEMENLTPGRARRLVKEVS